MKSAAFLLSRALFAFGGIRCVGVRSYPISVDESIADSSAIVLAARRLLLV